MARLARGRCALAVAGLAAGAGLAAACAGPGPGAAPAASGVAPVPADAPADVSGRFDAVWPYLLDRYDADGDGAIARAEYSRERFERLDRDGDGRLTRDDFARPVGMMDPRRMAAMRGYAVIARYFHADDDADRLLLDELRWSFGRHDADGDGGLEEDELREAVAALDAVLPADDSGMVAALMEGTDPWSALAAATDADASGAVEEAELVAFFGAQEDAEGVWELRSAAEDGAAGGPGPDGWPTGPRPGALAPDFTLAPPDGGEAVTLSSFRGKRPVALVFGSYT